MLFHASPLAWPVSSNAIVFAGLERKVRWDLDLGCGSHAKRGMIIPQVVQAGVVAEHRRVLPVSAPSRSG